MHKQFAEAKMADQYRFEAVIDDICRMNWSELSQDELMATAWAYYFFSIQFRENLNIACRLHPDDAKLQELTEGECETDNLSPWPGVATAGEKMNHDEFMRRSLRLVSLPLEKRVALAMLGQRYLDNIRGMDPIVRAISIGSYEAGGLEAVFRAFLTAPDWGNPVLQAFHHFLVKHIKFDSDPDHGHGALSRHLVPDDRLLPLWKEFRTLLAEAVPSLVSVQPALSQSRLPETIGVSA
jgi:hypothetical protein